MNLLPQKVIQEQQAQKIKFGLFLMQILIVLAIVCTFVLLRVAQDNANTRLAVATELALGLDDSPLLLIMEIENLRTVEDDTFFCSSWITSILETVPYGGYVAHIRIDSSNILVVAYATGINCAGAHMRALSYSGFENISMGTIQLQHNDKFRYELHIDLGYE